MNGIVITSDNKISVQDFKAPLHVSLGKVVGGYIEVVNPRGLPAPYCMIVNEEGLLRGQPLNAVGSYLYQTYLHGSPIVGDIVILKHGMTWRGHDIVGLGDSEISELCRQLYELVHAIERADKKAKEEDEE